MGDARQLAALAVEANGASSRAVEQDHGVLREARVRKVINPEYMEPLLRETEAAAEAKATRILKRMGENLGPDIADAAAEGFIRAITIHVGGGKAAFDLFTRAADTALVPALRTASSS